MSFTNLYYKRAVGTPRACYVCYKPTSTVLATANTIDFIYVCEAHLEDPGFASQVGETSDGVGAGGVKKMGLSPEEIAKVKEEWEERQKRKQEKLAKEKEQEKEQEKEKEKDKEQDKKDGDKQGKQDKDSKQDTKVPAKSPPPSSGSTTPTHKRYALHRDIFALRLAEHRKRRQAAQAQALAPLLPATPRAPPPPSSQA